MITLSPQARRALLKRELEVAFRDYFRESTIDFWDENGAPEELVEIAFRVLRDKLEGGGSP